MEYVLLGCSALAYAVGIVAQAVAARRTARREHLDVGLLARLFTDRVYLVGFGAQVLGFVLAFLARATLPLYLVQAGASTAVGIAAVIGAVVLGWRIKPGEIAALAVMAVGLLALAGAARPSEAHDITVAGGLALVGTLVVVIALAAVVTRLGGPVGSVSLGVLAGVAFAVLAIASRPIANDPLAELPLQPLAWLMVVAAVVGQSLLAAALQRGTPTSTMATMDATGVLLGSAVGLLVLGDAIAEGREGWVVLGLALVVSGVVAMARLTPHPTVAAVTSPPVHTEEVTTG